GARLARAHVRARHPAVPAWDRPYLMVDVQAYLDSMSAEILARTDVLPQARLEQLAQHGVILSVMTFEDHMNPQVHWIEPEEFGIAFDLLTERERPMPEAA